MLPLPPPKRNHLCPGASTATLLSPGMGHQLAMCDQPLWYSQLPWALSPSPESCRRQEIPFLWPHPPGVWWPSLTSVFIVYPLTISFFFIAFSGYSRHSCAWHPSLPLTGSYFPCLLSGVLSSCDQGLSEALLWLLMKASLASLSHLTSLLLPLSDFFFFSNPSSCEGWYSHTCVHMQSISLCVCVCLSLCLCHPPPAPPFP